MSVQPNTPRPAHSATEAPVKPKHTRWTLLRTARRLEQAADTLVGLGEGNQAARLRVLAAKHRQQAMRTRWF